MPLKTETALRKDKGTMAELQHRHFATIATIIDAMTIDGAPLDAACHYAIASHFATMLASTNPNFDRKRFLRACGI